MATICIKNVWLPYNCSMKSTNKSSLPRSQVQLKYAPCAVNMKFEINYLNLQRYETNTQPQHRTSSQGKWELTNFSGRVKARRWLIEAKKVIVACSLRGEKAIDSLRSLADAAWGAKTHEYWNFKFKIGTIAVKEYFLKDQDSKKKFLKANKTSQPTLKLVKPPR